MAKKKEINLILPWPVSTNAYWRNLNGRTLISKKGRLFKKAVARAVQWHKAAQHLNSRLSVEVLLYPPDKRRRDIDNFGTKSILDALQNAGVYRDDSQIDELVIKRVRVEKGGVAVVRIWEL